MNLIGNVKQGIAGIFGAGRQKTGLYAKSPAELQAMRDGLQRRMDAFRGVEAHLDSREWTWLTQTFIPVRMTELLQKQRQEIRPEDAQGNLRFAGRFDELEQLSEYLGDVKRELEICQGEINRVNNAMEIAKRRTA